MKFQKNMSDNLEKILNTIIVLSFFLYSFYRIFLIFSYDYDLGGIEQNVIFNLQKMLFNKPLYTSPEDINFDLYMYTPISQFYYYIFLKIFSIFTELNYRKLLIFCRTLSLLNNFALLLTINKIFSLFKVNKSQSLSIIFLIFIYLPSHNFSVRPDSLYILINFISIYYFLVYLYSFQFTKKSLTAFRISILFAILSYLTKQSGIILIISYCIYFIFIHDYKKLFYMISIYTLTIFISLFGLYLYYGFPFIQNSILAVSNGINLVRSYEVWNQYFSKTHFIIILYPITLFLNKNLKKNNVSIFNTILTFCFFGFGLVTSLKIGSHLNYFTNFTIMSLIYSIHFFNNNYFSLKSTIRFYLIIFIITISLSYNLIIRRYFYSEATQFPDHYKNIYLNSLKISNYLKDNLKTNEYILSIDNQYIKNLLPQQTIFPNTDMYHLTPFNYSKFRELLKTKQLKYILVIKGEKPMEFLGMKIIHMEKFKSFKNYDLYINNQN